MVIAAEAPLTSIVSHFFEEVGSMAETVGKNGPPDAGAGRLPRE